MVFLSAALAMASFFYQPHSGPPAATHRLYGVDGWRIGVRHDTFTGAVTCSLEARSIYYKSDTLIFRTRRGADTNHAMFRIDEGPARPVAEAFHEDEAHGIFPQRGFIDDPAGGDVALPASYVAGKRRLWIRVSPKMYPRYYDISRFAEALAGARAAGCTDAAFTTAS